MSMRNTSVFRAALFTIGVALFTHCGSEGNRIVSGEGGDAKGGDQSQMAGSTPAATGELGGQVAGTAAGQTGANHITGGAGGTSNTNTGTSGGSTGNAAGATPGTSSAAGTGGNAGPPYREIQKIFDRTCAMSTCHKSGPTCPFGSPIGTPVAEDCPDPDPIGWRNMGLDLSSPTAVAKTAVNQYASQPRLDRTCGKYLDLAPRYTSTRLKRIIPGDSRHSYLVMKLDLYDREQKLAGTDGSRCHGGTMPHQSKAAQVQLAADEVSRIRAWIDAGARTDDSQ
jgi:hypothetical protein